MKKILSIFLAVIIIISSCSVNAFSLTSGSYTYILENGKAVITRYSGSASSVLVPSVLGGYSVYAIGESAFQNNSIITSVTIPNSVSEVRANAFRNCSKLAKITLAEKCVITRFGENAITGTAYYNDKSNWTVRPKNLNTSGDISFGNEQDSIPWEFIKATELEYLYIKDINNAEKILVKCHAVGQYTVKYTTTTVADGALRGESGLVEFRISVKTVSIGARAFKDCTSLSAITLNDSTKIYDDAFLNTKIYNTPSNWKEDFLTVGTRAIASKTDCNELVVGDGITFISNGTIGTRNVYIPASVTKIDIDAFVGRMSAIFGYKETYAETFANENGFTFIDLDNIFLGDMDFDGTIDPNDYAIFYSSVMCGHNMSKYERLAGDLTLDGTVDAFDLLYFQILLNDKTAKMKGDINGDGKINRDDGEFLRKTAYGSVTGVGENFLIRSDLNGDGVVDGFDVIYLDLYLNGKVNLK